MELFVLGTSHAVAPTGLRERLHVDPEEMHRTLVDLRRSGLVHEAVALSTCGRLEVYATSSRPFRAAGALRRMIGTRAGVSREQQLAHSYMHRGAEAVRHLFGVAAGLDSVVHGEAQILGQVREVLNRPAKRETAGPVLDRLFQRAVATGRRVRRETAIGQGAASLASAALGILRREVGALESVSVLVIGAGEIGSLVTHLLRKTGVTDITVVNRTTERARQLAGEMGVAAAGLEELPALLRRVDLVVGAVAAPERTLGPAQLDPERRPRWFLDLSHPRAFDPALAELDGVSLFDLEHVSERMDSARAARRRQVPLAEGIVAEEVERYETWLRSRESVEVIKAVRTRVLQRARAEAERLSRGRPEHEREEIRRMARRLARALLHEPTLALRSADPASVEGSSMVESVASMFGLGDAADRAP